MKHFQWKINTMTTAVETAENSNKEISLSYALEDFSLSKCKSFVQNYVFCRFYLLPI